MRKIVFALLFALAAIPAAAQNCSHGSNFVLVPFASETVDVSTASIGLTAATFKPSAAGEAWEAFITVDTAAVNFWLDGTAPTSSVGHAAATGSTLIICRASLPLFRAIRSGGSDGKLRVTYFRPPQG